MKAIHTFEVPGLFPTNPRYFSRRMHLVSKRVHLFRDLLDVCTYYY